MSRSVLVASIAVLTLLVPRASAQVPDDLESVLRTWEKATREVRSVSVVLEREVFDKASQARETQKGFAMFLRAKGPDDLNRFRFELKSAGDPAAFQKFVGGGKFLYSYEPANKVVRVFHLAAFKKAVLDRISLLSFIFEMDAELAKDRYEIELSNPSGSDMSHHYLRVLPKRSHDRLDFTEARITLQRANHLPRQIWYRQPNGKEITWNFSEMQIDSDKVSPLQFNPEVPECWHLERIAAPR